MVYIILGKGFEEIEAVTPGDILRRGGVDVSYSGIGGNLIEGAHGICLEAGLRAEEISPGAGDIVLIPGGLGGVETIEGSPAVLETIKKARSAGAGLAAICAGPRVLAGLGLLDGRKITCYPGMEDQMTGAVCTGEAVVSDGDVITGRAPGAAMDFGLAILGMIKGEETVKSVRGGLVYDR